MNEVLAAVLLVNVLVTPVPTAPASFAFPLVEAAPVPTQPVRKILAKETLDLTSRNMDNVVSGIFRDNILLNLHYIKGDQAAFSRLSGTSTFAKASADKSASLKEIDWEKVREPFEFSIVLEPGELLAFHDELLPEFEKYREKAKTGWTKFSVNEGYKVLDGLSGNGVCHLASLINWVASEAGMEVTAKVNHDFYPVPGVDRKYGTSIVYIPEATTTQMQNLYVINNFSEAVVFSFEADKDKVELEVRSNP